MALKIGVVGIRGIGQRHLECHSKDELAQIVAVCDVVKERADQAAKKHGVKAYYRLKDMLDAEELDIVDVTTGGNENGSWHFEPVMEALDRGRNVLVEKPISNDVHEARQMVAKAREKGVYFGCNLNHYFTPPCERAQQYIRDGQIGEMVYCLHRMGFAGGEETYKRGKGSKSEGFPYFHTKAFLSHPFSIMRHFCGDVTHVQAFFERPHFRRRTNDVMVSVNSIHVKFANGCIGYLFSQRGDVTMGLGGWWSVEVGGTKGTFCVENCVEKVTYWPAPGKGGAARPENLELGAAGPATVTESGFKQFNLTFPWRLHAFLEDVANQVPKDRLRASGLDALAALEYTWAAMESYEQGGVVVRPHPVPLLKGDPLAQMNE
ncbi:MAG: Gfo/Idh/MocA family oxidoreductase [Candidatus Sumerlaeota bacterium]|nr:Gfo/Idh/MocA family oxidoreductase [Candidatus Sumerlaeota bacterium]